MKTDLLENVKKVIEKNSLLSPGDSVLIAVSGGADSVCLFDVLFSLKDEFNLSLYVAHLNHLLRDDEAKRDELFVRSLCEKYSVPFFCEEKDVLKLSKDTGKSVEEAGRYARYDFFLRLKNEHGIDKIATAHNKNDNVETVCMRIMRGTGIQGLSGIPLKNDLSVVRPLLNTSRSEIEEYLKEKSIDFITDSSNLEDDYTRNKIRHKLLPYIEKNHNESFIDTFSGNITGFGEAAHYLNSQTEKKFRYLAIPHSFGFEFDLCNLKKEDTYIIKSVMKKAIFELTKKEASANLVSLIYEATLSECDTSLSVSDKLSVYKKYDKLFFVLKKEICDYEYEKKSSEITINEAKCKLFFEESLESPSYSDKNVIYFKPPYTGGSFKVRNRRKGDKICLGSLGHKKIKDLLIDEKVPVFLRDEVPLLLYDDEIIWVCGIRDNPKYRAENHDSYIKIVFTKEI